MFTSTKVQINFDTIDWEFENQCAILTLYLVNFIFLSTFNKLVLAVSSTKHCKSNVGGCGSVRLMTGILVAGYLS